MGSTLLLLASALAAAEDTIKIPIEVDQKGKSIYFVTDADSNVLQEAVQFCMAHLPGMPQEDCASKLVEQVATVRSLREEAQAKIPGITFTVRDLQGQEHRFVHDEGANPRHEARAFCQLHFATVSEPECVEAMLSNAQKALEEVGQKAEL